VEDSAVGLRAAKAAGLFCAVAPSELTGTQDFSTADIRLAALGDLASWLVAGSPGFSASQPVEGT